MRRRLETSWESDSRRAGGSRYGWLLLFLGMLLLSLSLLWLFRDRLRLPRALLEEAQEARPKRAAALYQRLAEKLPQIAEYAQLWAAEDAMPDLEAIRTLQAVVAFRPQSPAAYQAYIAIARHYAHAEDPAAEEAYRAALDLHATVALRQELARYLEAQGGDDKAYAEYRRILKDQADAFAGMRRTGADPLVVARDLSGATYYSDALEVLRGVDDPEALSLRAGALAGLGRYAEAETVYRQWLEDMPGDASAQLGLAQTLGRLGRLEESLSLYEEVPGPDSALARAQLLESTDPKEALALYVDSPYPLAWWSATTMLEEQGRLTETLPIYARLGRTNTYFADDAAYRLYVLGQRLGDEAAEAEGRALLDGFGLNWLALRATGEELRLSTSAPLDTAGQEILEKARTLEEIGRGDLAYLELAFAAQFRRAPEVILSAAEDLYSRGYVVDAQTVAATFLMGHARAPRAFWELSYPKPHMASVEAAAAEFGVDPLLIWSVMREESRYDPEAISYVGARGLMQVMPSTQTWIAEQLGESIPPGDAFDPQTNIRMGAWFLRFLTDYFDGDLDLVIAGYNGGAGSVDNWLADPLVSDRDDLLRWIRFGETREYLARVSLSYRVYQELYARAGGQESG